MYIELHITQPRQTQTHKAHDTWLPPFFMNWDMYIVYVYTKAVKFLLCVGGTCVTPLQWIRNCIMTERGRSSTEHLQLSLPLDRVHFVDTADSLQRCHDRLTQVSTICVPTYTIHACNRNLYMCYCVI